MAQLHLMLRPVIHTRKEIVDSVNLGVTGGVTTNIPLATTVNDYVGAVGTVEVGAVIKWIYLFVQILPSTTGTANVDFYVIKSPAGVPTPVPGATGGSPSRKFILHEEKGIPGNASDGAYPLTFKGVIKIPKGRQRMAEDDSIRLLVRGADDYNQCSKCIYKPQM